MKTRNCTKLSYIFNSPHRLLIRSPHGCAAPAQGSKPLGWLGITGLDRDKILKRIRRDAAARMQSTLVDLLHMDNRPLCN